MTVPTPPSALPDADDPDDEAIVRVTVTQELEQAAQFARTLDPAAFKSGDWFVQLTRQLVRTYDQNARASYFLNKYRGFPPDDIADARVRTGVRYATITGGLTGVSVTANQLLAVPTAGTSLMIMTGAIGAEMICLSSIQMRLVLDLATIYGQAFDADDPEDILTVFNYALGAAPVGAAGKVIQKAAVHGSRTVVKKVVSKGTLKSVQDLGRLVGIKILQRSIIKYAAPVASAAVGSGYNYITTKSLGAVAKAHMRNRGRASGELRTMLSTGAAAAGLALPAAMMVMAKADGVLQGAEKELYRALLANVDQGDEAALEFERLMRDRTALLSALATADSPDMRSGIVEALGLMAAYDGDLSQAETEFLTEVAAHLGVDIDFEALAKQADTYRVASDGEGAMARARGAVEQAARSGSDVAAAVGGRMREGATKAGAAALAVARGVRRRKASSEMPDGSPLDVEGVDLGLTTEEIDMVVQEGRRPT